VIQAITFDFWDTLFVAVGARDLRRQRIKEALARAGCSGVSDADVERASQRAWQEWDRVWEQERRTFGALRWTSLVLTGLGASLAGSELETLAHAMAASGVEVQPPLVDGVAQVLPRLAARYRLGVVCDTGLSPGWMLRQRMQDCGILGHFTQLTFSDELGVSKPHPDAFLTTLARLDAPPEASVHVGDYPRTDVAGAQGIGMRAIRFTGAHDRPDGEIRADAEIHSYDELEPLLERWI
jgi:putative hydrolase of the HAD superfamily